jgi:uncharacterized protein (DUF362 family)
VRAAIDALGGIRRFISRNDVVVIKPNIGWDRTPETAANTNPEVVATLVRLCLESGAKTVKVFDRTSDDARRAYIQSGIVTAARAAGAQVSHVDTRRFRDVAIPNGVSIKSWPIYIDILEADKLINVPVLKQHSVSRLTMTYKNWMGVMGGNRGRVHQNLAETLSDLATIIKTDLAVLDCVRVLTANGPKGGNPADVKRLDTVVAGVDQVAIDSFGASLMNLTWNDIDSVKVAARRGLGRADLSKLNIRRIEL